MHASKGNFENLKFSPIDLENTLESRIIGGVGIIGGGLDIVIIINNRGDGQG